MSLKLKPFRTVLKDKDHGWGPFFWLLYFGFFSFTRVRPRQPQAMASRWSGCRDLHRSFIGIFLLEKPRATVHIGGMILLGVVFLLQCGCFTFFIFAGAFVPFMVETQAVAITCLGAIVAVAGVEGWRLHVNGWTLFYAAAFPVIVGGSNVFFAERNRMNRKLRQGQRRNRAPGQGR